MNGMGLKMRWKIAGANRQTGEEVAFLIEASTAAEASRMAGATGVMIERIQPIIEGAVPSEVVKRSPITTNPAPAPLPLARRGHNWGLTILGSFLIVAGIVCVGFAVMDADRARVAARREERSENVWAGITAGISSGMSERFAISNFANSFLLIGVGAICIRLGQPAR